MNGCNNAKGKPIADKELWVKIYEILKDVRIYHQTPHTKQTTKVATENREVDALIDKQLKFKCQAPRISAHSVQNASQETTVITLLLKGLKHSSEQIMSISHSSEQIMSISGGNGSIEKLEYSECRKVMTSKFNKYTQIKGNFSGEQISTTLQGTLLSVLSASSR